MLKSLRNRVKRDNDPRVLIVGLDNAGKTTLLNTLGDSGVPGDERECHAAPEGPTQGFNIKNLNRDGKCARLCDLGGQRALREYWQDYYNNTDCIMYVVDSSDARRLEESHAAFVDVLEGVPGVPVLVFANKQDLATAKDPQVIAESLHLQDFRDRKWQIQGCSAKSGAGLEEENRERMKKLQHRNLVNNSADVTEVEGLLFKRCFRGKISKREDDEESDDEEEKWRLEVEKMVRSHK